MQLSEDRVEYTYHLCKVGAGKIFMSKTLRRIRATSLIKVGFPPRPLREREEFVNERMRIYKFG